MDKKQVVNELIKLSKSIIAESVGITYDNYAKGGVVLTATSKGYSVLHDGELKELVKIVTNNISRTKSEIEKIISKYFKNISIKFLNKISDKGYALSSSGNKIIINSSLWIEFDMKDEIYDRSGNKIEIEEIIDKVMTLMKIGFEK